MDPPNRDFPSSSSSGGPEGATAPGQGKPRFRQYFNGGGGRNYGQGQQDRPQSDRRRGGQGNSHRHQYGGGSRNYNNGHSSGGGGGGYHNGGGGYSGGGYQSSHFNRNNGNGNNRGNRHDRHDRHDRQLEQQQPLPVPTPAPAPRPLYPEGLEDNGTTYYYGAPPGRLEELSYENLGSNSDYAVDFGAYGTVTSGIGHVDAPTFEPVPTTQALPKSSQGQGQGQRRNYYKQSEASRSDNWRSQLPETTYDQTSNNGNLNSGEDIGNSSNSRPPRRKLVLRAPPPPKETKEQVQRKEKESQQLPKETKNQRDALIDQLNRNNYECMVCCAKIFRRNPIWSCRNCYNIFHQVCIKKWVTSSAVEGSWRCPGCQNVAETLPDDYFCFCGKTKDPSPSTDVPHSCMLVCGKVKSGGADCTHLCSLQCHPGPCPPCTDQVKRKCECGKTSAFVQCSNKNAVICGSPCEKLLNCGLHRCTINCHAGSCQDCTEKVTLSCHCKRNKKEVLCSKDHNMKSRPSYCCEQICDRTLNCKNHKCSDLCHLDQCSPCPASTDVVISCPCGQTSVSEACKIRQLPPRKSCLDPIPTCGKICKKILTCGPPGSNHQCEKNCHLETPCPPCEKSTTVKCRCGNQEMDISCKELLSSGDFLCARKCAKKRSCGRHKCTNTCCIDPEHICLIVCDRPLRCGNHRCEQLCHNGHCRTCPNVSFEELRCECGAAVIYPPVACGTKPPPCIQPCRRQHSCDHPVMHNCHSDPVCPPCSYLTEKWCYGQHELRKNVLCHVTHVSCGTPCQKLLGCGRHKCPRPCHQAPCQRAGDICKLPCLERRKICGHSCAAPCHEGKCPDTKCKEMTEASCICGRRKEILPCWKREIEFDRIVAAAVSVRLNNRLFLDGGQERKWAGRTEISVEGLTDLVRKETSKVTVMDCDKECARIERTRKMAQALQLENPDVETRLGIPQYSDFCKKFTQKYPQFVEMVHTKLTDVVMQVKKSKKINQTYGFDSMNREKRQLIHEYSDHFGCLSESFDEEPNRNVIVTASKDKSYLPSVSLIDVVFRQTTVKTDRKNVYEDLELVGPSKAQIIGPANRKLIPKTGPGKSGMVYLNGS